MARKFKVLFDDNEILELYEGVSFRDISENFKDKFNYDIIGVKVDNDFCDLSDTLKKNCKIEFFDRSSEYGNEVYSRSAKFILIFAINQVLGLDAKIVFEHSQEGGIYCTIENKFIDDTIISNIENKMNDIVVQNFNFVKSNVSRMDAIKYFKKNNRLDSVNVLKYISNTYITLYKIDDLYDYFHGRMAFSTGQIKDFKLTYLEGNGFVLSIPEVFKPDAVGEYKHHQLVFDKYLDYTNWGKKIGLGNASDLNYLLSNDLTNEIINLSEAYYDGQLSNIADIISNSNKDIKLVLLAGPSSSGKTTTAKKLSIYLRSKGFFTHSLSIDDYFVDRDKTPKDENGEYDFESLKCVDTELFNEHLTRLLAGEEVLLPTYNFVLGKREFHNKLKLGEKDIIVIEGLHALNDELTKTIDRNNKYKIFIAPLTQINLDDHNYVHSTDIRKLRRIIRDARTRGKTAEETLQMWKKITEGEVNNIYPYQDQVDKVVNSSLVYEVAVLKIYVEPLLFNVKEDDPVYPEALRLINLLRNFLPMPSDLIPPNSVIREFIGGSCFNA